MKTQTTPAINNMTWAGLLRVLLKAVVLFALCNLIYALTAPLSLIGQVSLYNTLLPGRERLPYGDDPDDYNVSLFDLPTMFASQTVSQAKAADEFRVLLVGDSATWGWFLPVDDTYSAYLNAADLTRDGRRVVAYNLGYPIMSLTKDLLILDEALKHDPDLIVWLVTLESMPPDKQLFPPIVQRNAARVRRLSAAYDLAPDLNNDRLRDPDVFERTIIGQRRDLADVLRLQTYAVTWTATGIDQFMPAEIERTPTDLDDSLSWEDHDSPTDLTRTDLAFDVLRAGGALAGDVPVIIVNEPIFVSAGANSDIRYNEWYPRWAYDQYRDLLAVVAAEEGWQLLDLWDAVEADAFTDSPVHLSAAGAQQLATLIGHEILE